MPFPLVRPITIIVDCIHNATIRKNQDEFCLFGGGEFDIFVEKFCRKNLRPDQPAPCPSRSRGKRRCEPYSGTPFASAGTDSRDAEESERVIRNDTPRSRSDRRGKYPGTEAAIGKDRCFILVKIATSERVRGIFFFPRLFLDSPPGTPYLVCVMNFHHKIRYH